MAEANNTSTPSVTSKFVDRVKAGREKPEVGYLAGKVGEKDFKAPDGLSNTIQAAGKTADDLTAHLNQRAQMVAEHSLALEQIEALTKATPAVAEVKDASGSVTTAAKAEVPAFLTADEAKLAKEHLTKSHQSSLKALDEKFPDLKKAFEGKDVKGHNPLGHVQATREAFAGDVAGKMKSGNAVAASEAYQNNLLEALHAAKGKEALEAFQKKDAPVYINGFAEKAEELKNAANPEALKTHYTKAVEDSAKHVDGKLEGVVKEMSFFGKRMDAVKLRFAANGTAGKAGIITVGVGAAGLALHGAYRLISPQQDPETGEREGSALFNIAEIGGAAGLAHLLTSPKMKAGLEGALKVARA